jgi:translation initiation factor 2 beta subunit (eIF-2beta)/eIF-5
MRRSVMALSTCVKCGGQSFEVVEGNVVGANFRLWFIQCSRCGGVVGVQEYLNVSAMVGDVREKVDRLFESSKEGRGTPPA